MSRRLGLVLVFAVAGMAIGWWLMSPGPGDGERKVAEVIAQDAGSTSPGDSAREHGYDTAEALAFGEGALGPADGVAEPVSEGAALDQQDAEWPELPRGWSLAFEMALACNPAFTARPLFRSYELNPRDVYIPPEDRKLLTSALDALRPRLAEGQKVWSRAYSEAFQEALASGAVRELDVNLRGGRAETASGNVAVTSISIEELQAAGADMGTVRGGKVVGASRQDFALSRAAVEEQRFLGRQLSLCLITWFEQRATLENHEAEALRAIVFQ